MEIKVKCHKKYYDRIAMHEKTAEIRFNDRDYQVGDKLVLFEVGNDGKWIEDSDGTNKGTAMVKYITHILSANDFEGLKKGYVMLSLANDMVCDRLETKRILGKQYDEIPKPSGTGG